MIERVHIENFRCLKDVTVELGPLTILVGPNACGKTALLEALDRARELTAGDVWRQKAELLVLRTLLWQGASRAEGNLTVAPIYVNEYEVESEYRARLKASTGWRSYEYQRIRLHPDALRQPNVVALQGRLADLGGNLANVFASLPRRKQIGLAEQLCQLVPMFRDVDVRPLGYVAGHHQLRFEDRWTPDLWYTPEQVSDGTMLTLAFLVLQHQDPPVDLLCIEEPERGLHPWLLGEVLDLLRKLSTGQLGPRPVQVILATHSAELLDHARPEEVRFMSRDATSGAVAVQAADTTTPEWREAYELYQRSLGGLWLAGGLGGVPGT